MGLTATLNMLLGRLLESVSSEKSPQQLLWVVLGLMTYLGLVSMLRFRRKKTLHKRYSCYATRDLMGTMTDRDAWAIQKTIMQTEFPFIVLKSLQFALFRV
jgi:hypothetical protein